MSIGRPISEKRLFQTDLGNSRSRSWVWSKGKVTESSILQTHFFFISHQSDQQILRCSYLKIWPWNIQGQGHEWNQWLRSHSIPSIQPMHFSFVSHQSDQPFLRYGQKSVWPWRNTSEIFKKIHQKKVCNRTCPKYNQIISMTKSIKLPHFKVIGREVLTLPCRQAHFC